MTPAKGAMHRITAEDGHSLECWIEPAKGARRGGLVVLQEIFGITDQLKSVASRYAGLGYEVAIPALFDRQAPNSVIPFDDAARGRNIMLALEREVVMRDVAAAVDTLAEGGRVGVMGFCWGGGLALRAAQTLEVAAAVSFYGTRLADMLGDPLKAPFQGHFGTRDDHTPPELIERLKAALPKAEIFLYDAGHAFANEARPSYVEAAAALAHSRAGGFLATHVG